MAARESPWAKRRGHASGHAPFTAFRVTHLRGHASGHAPFDSLKVTPSPPYGPVLLAESPVRDVFCPGCLVGCETLAESDAELESVELESEPVPGIAMVSAPPRMESRPTPVESNAPTRPGCAVVSIR